jgi:twinkle protein
MTEDESEFVQKEPCPECGSKDNLARYSDGHAYCFGCEYYEPASGEETQANTKKRQQMSKDLLRGKHRALKARGITEETCRQFDYMVGKMSGEPVHIANYRSKDGVVSAQHIRTADKNFPWIGKKKNLQLFGQHRGRDAASKVIITEGELDAMSVSQVLGKKSRWPVVSIISGAKGATKDIADNIQWVDQHDEVIIMFDMDEVGQEAAVAVAKMLRPGKAKIASLPLKDANDMLMAGKAAELVDAIFSAKAWRPEGVVSIGDIRSKITEAPVEGLPWWHEGLTKATLGRRMGEAVTLAAGTGVGKTDFITQQIEYDINTLNEKVGYFALEQQPFETGRRIAGKMAGKRFHIPPDPDHNDWTDDDLSEALDKLEEHNNLRMFDHFGTADWAMIEATIRYLYHADGVRIFYVDHLTALAAHAEDERKELEAIMADIGGLVKELDIWVLLISHLATPDGKPHEEGGRVMIRHFKGSRAIGYWSHFMFGLERNQQAEDEDERQTTTLRVLKDRVTGQATGKTFAITYDQDTGLLVESTFSDFDAVVDGEVIF